MLDGQPHISDLINYLQLEVITVVILVVACVGLLLNLIDAFQDFFEGWHSALEKVRSFSRQTLLQAFLFIFIAGIVVLLVRLTNTFVSSIVAIALCLAYATMNGLLIYQVFSSEEPRVINQRERLGFALVPLMFALLPWSNIFSFIFSKAYGLPTYGTDFILCFVFVVWFGFAVSSVILNIVIDFGIIRSWASKHAEKTSTSIVKTTLKISVIVALILTHAIFSYDDVLSQAGVEVYMLVASAVIIPIIVSQVLEARDRSKISILQRK